MINRILFKAFGVGPSYIKGDISDLFLFSWLQGRVTRGAYQRMGRAGVISSNLRQAEERQNIAKHIAKDSNLRYIITFHHRSRIEPCVHVIMIQQVGRPVKCWPETKPTKGLASKWIIWSLSRWFLNKGNSIGFNDEYT